MKTWYCTFWQNFLKRVRFNFTLVSKKVKEGAFGRIYPNTLGVSGDENYQTWGNLSGTKANAAKYFMVYVTSFVLV